MEWASLAESCLMNTALTPRTCVGLASLIRGGGASPNLIQNCGPDWHWAVMIYPITPVVVLYGLSQFGLCSHVGLRQLATRVSRPTLPHPEIPFTIPFFYEYTA